MLPKYPSKIRVCHCKQTDADPLVKNDLAITPHRMYELVSQGIPINEQTAVNESDFVDGYSELDFEPPHIYSRHADMISAWNEQIDAREKILKHEVMRAEYGLDEIKTD